MSARHDSHLSIAAKTLLSHLALALVVILISGALSYVMSTQYVREARIRDLTGKAQHIAENMQSFSADGVAPGRKFIELYQKLTDAAVFILDGDAENPRLRRYHTGKQGGEDFEWVEVGKDADRQLALRVLNGETVSVVRRFDFTQSTVLFVAAPVRDDTGAVRGGVVLAQSMEQVRQLSHGIQLTLAVAIGVSLLLAMLLAMQLTRRLLRPIHLITQAARRMTNDDSYAERITSLPNDEIGDLGRALNTMSARLIDVIGTLRKERDKLDLVISNIGEGVFAVDVQWNIVHANAAFLELMELDRAEEALNGEGECASRLRETLRACLNTARAVRGAWPNPSGRELSVLANPLEDESGSMLGTVCLLRDVSEAERLEQLRRDYVANVSHELRTPLTGIRGMVEPLIDGVIDTDEERQECYRVILKETIRLEKLVREMLDMSRLQDGRVAIELEPLELPGILEAAVRGMRGIAEQSGVSLSLETDGSRLACLGNEDRIAQVLVILIDNALSFTPEGGSVTVFARDEGDHVALGVRDTGCGIEPKDLPFIWERFYKADKSRMRTTGTGLGLAIAKRVTELMGGEISVTSALGEGSEFTFTLKKQEQ